MVVRENVPFRTRALQKSKTSKRVLGAINKRSVHGVNPKMVQELETSTKICSLNMHKRLRMHNKNH